MSNKEKLYDAFGELIYLVAIADGIVQEEEKEALKKLLATHPKANEIQWSFEYELSKNNSIDYLYKRVLGICHQNGPDPEYAFLLEVLNVIANSNNKVDEREQEVINRFSRELIDRFENDLQKIKDNNPE